MLRAFPVVFVLLAVALSLRSADQPQLAYSRRMFAVTAQFLDETETRVIPARPNQAKEKILIAFWTSEGGAVVSARVLDGPADLGQAATDAIYKWKFKPTSVNGQPMQIGSAVLFDFSKTPPATEVPKPMSVAQLSPGYEPGCLDGLINQQTASVAACKHQLENVLSDSHSTPLDQFTAYDQYGLVLMKYANDAHRALEEFSKAIELAPDRFSSTDAECGYVYWHRAAAEQQLGNSSAAERDFTVAQDTFRRAEKVIGSQRMADYYEGLAMRIAQQRH